MSGKNYGVKDKSRVSKSPNRFSSRPVTQNKPEDEQFSTRDVSTKVDPGLEKGCTASIFQEIFVSDTSDAARDLTKKVTRSNSSPSLLASREIFVSEAALDSSSYETLHEQENETPPEPSDNYRDQTPTKKGLDYLVVPVEFHGDQASAVRSSASGPKHPDDGIKEAPASDCSEASPAPGMSVRYRRFASVSEREMRSKSPLQSRSFAMKVERGREVVAVMGAGDYGTALAIRLRNAGYHVLLLTRVTNLTRIRLNELGYSVLEPRKVTEGDQSVEDASADADEPSDGVIEVVTRHDGLARASVVFVTVANRDFSRRLLRLLRNKILVDVSNRIPSKSGVSPSNAEELQALVPSSAVVKSLNTISAWSLLWRTKLIPKQNPTCGDAAWAVQTVQNILREASLPCTRAGRLCNAAKLEGLPLTFFPEAQVAMGIITAVVTFFTILNLFRNQLCPLMANPETSVSDLFENFLLDNTLLGCGQSAIMLLTLTYLPGVLAAYLQLLRGTKYQPFPAFLDAWLRARKYLGLAAAMIIFLHMLTVILSGSAGLDLLRSNLQWMYPTALGLGAIGVLLLLMQSVFSIPGVSDQLSWSESQFVFSRLGWLAYIVGCSHVVLMEWNDLLNFTSSRQCYVLIQGSQIVMMAAALTVALKVLLLPFDWRLTAIRRGEGNRTRSRKTKPRKERMADPHSSIV
ncbi:metalloreductase STEAP4-like [Hyalella azteca]|uniref:Metalloreductase STEAP4-like n=1 Tax=Hyalella azteca TaxID=294128 RepID=A0A8B7PBC0_HYAAZ|nr:metalloreductase STEAP4-like [Hyalella azteca]